MEIFKYHEWLVDNNTTHIIEKPKLYIGYIDGKSSLFSNYDDIHLYHCYEELHVDFAGRYLTIIENIDFVNEQLVNQTIVQLARSQKSIDELTSNDNKLELLWQDYIFETSACNNRNTFDKIYNYCKFIGETFCGDFDENDLLKVCHKTIDLGIIND